LAGFVLVALSTFSRIEENAIGLGIGLMGLGGAALGIYLALETDELMTAMATHDFFEKQSVIDSYAGAIDQVGFLDIFELHRMVADASAARQLRRWAPEVQLSAMANSLDYIQARVSRIDDTEVETRLIEDLQTISKEIRSGSPSLLKRLTKRFRTKTTKDRD
jgi:hypothetical protein